MQPGTHQLVPIDMIRLDKENPGINRYLASYREVSQANILMALGAGGESGQESGTTFASLRESIRTNGGIIHPIIVNRRADGTMVAIEGRVQLALYKVSNREDDVCGVVAFNAKP
jgi:hypothetical protein